MSQVVTQAFSRFAKKFAHRKVLIMGLGLLGSGVADARIFSEIGCDVRVTDLKTKEVLSSSLMKLKDLPLSYTLGEHQLKDIVWADVIVRNPGIPREHPLLLEAAKLNKKIMMNAALTAKFADVPIIGVTGTRGKSTTTHLIYNLLKQTSLYDQVLLGGNLPGDSSLSLLKQLSGGQKSLIVMELSSWQLQGFAAESISPHISVITNLYPDHLNYYASMSAYAEDKQLIFKHQGPEDYLVLNPKVSLFHDWVKLAPSQVIWSNPEDLPPHLNLKLLGEHNLDNAALAWAVGRLLKIPPSKIQAALESFAPLPFRLETVAVYQGIQLINDSTSTTPVACLTALNSVPLPITLIAGGNDKKLPLTELAQVINTKVQAVVLLPGTGTDKLKPLLRADLLAGVCPDLPSALKLALERTSKTPATVLFSPGFTSFGLFQNEFDRGTQFNLAVNKLS